MTGNGVAVGYYQSRNFGDLLSKPIFAHFGMRAYYAPLFIHAEVIGVGSILHRAPPEFDGAVLGSGCIGEQYFQPLPRAKFLLVRGVLTRDIFGLPSSVALGDPGLIVDSVFRDSLDRKVGNNPIGLVPHFTDYGHPSIDQFVSRYPREVKLIDVLAEPREVIQKIAGCRAVFASSLHGLVIAESLGIPNGWLTLGNRIIGGPFKYSDYYSALDMRPAPLQFSGELTLAELERHAQLADAGKLEEVKQNIHQAFRSFRDSRGISVA